MDEGVPTANNIFSLQCKGVINANKEKSNISLLFFKFSERILTFVLNFRILVIHRGNMPMNVSVLYAMRYF